jgi:hypothetical protein
MQSQSSDKDKGSDMFTDKEIKNYRSRITKASRSFSVLGDMMLTMEIEHMEQDKRIALQQALLNSKKPMRYAFLDKKVGVQ